MPTLPQTRIADLLTPYLGDSPIPENLYDSLSTYLDLLLKWNARTNLTAIREPEEIVRRHLGESLFAGLHLAPLLEPNATLLDFGSGAGFPGLPIQLLLPQLRVTLAESQGKKASFLREAVRTLNLKTEVWAKRVEDLPTAAKFNAVTLRAVDNMPSALAAAIPRIAPAGWLAALTGDSPSPELAASTKLAIPGSAQTFLALQQYL